MKKKGKCTTDYQDYYILIYSEKERHKPATQGVGILINSTYKQEISDIKYINSSIVSVTINTKKGILNGTYKQHNMGSLFWRTVPERRKYRAHHEEEETRNLRDIIEEKT